MRLEGDAQTDKTQPLYLRGSPCLHPVYRPSSPDALRLSSGCSVRRYFGSRFSHRHAPLRRGRRPQTLPCGEGSIERSKTTAHDVRQLVAEELCLIYADGVTRRARSHLVGLCTVSAALESSHGQSWREPQRILLRGRMKRNKSFSTALPRAPQSRRDAQALQSPSLLPTSQIRSWPLA